jgi:hypothetical protein
MRRANPASSVAQSPSDWRSYCSAGLPWCGLIETAREMEMNVIMDRRPALLPVLAMLALWLHGAQVRGQAEEDAEQPAGERQGADEEGMEGMEGMKMGGNQQGMGPMT